MFMNAFDRLHAAANIVGAEQAFLHVEMVGDVGELLPRTDQRIAEHGALHQPEAERQDQFAAEAGGKFCVHDDEMATGTKLIPRPLEDGAVIRHGVVGQAEQHAVELFRCGVVAGVALRQFDVVPLIDIAQRLRLRQHAGRYIDAVNFPGRSDGILQVGKVPAGAASDFEHAFAAAQAEMGDGLFPQIRRQEKQPIEKWNKFGNAIISLADSIAVAIHPLVFHVSPPFSVRPPSRTLLHSLLGTPPKACALTVILYKFYFFHNPMAKCEASYGRMDTSQSVREFRAGFSSASCGRVHACKPEMPKSAAHHCTGPLVPMEIFAADSGFRWDKIAKCR